MTADPFTHRIKAICADRCAKRSEPPCWELPEILYPSPTVKPCAKCLHDDQHQRTADMFDSLRDSVTIAEYAFRLEHNHEGIAIALTCHALLSNLERRMADLRKAQGR